MLHLNAHTHTRFYLDYYLHFTTFLLQLHHLTTHHLYSHFQFRSSKTPCRNLTSQKQSSCLDFFPAPGLLRFLNVNKTMHRAPTTSSYTSPVSDLLVSFLPPCSLPPPLPGYLTPTTTVSLQTSSSLASNIQHHIHTHYTRTPSCTKTNHITPFAQTQQLYTHCITHEHQLRNDLLSTRPHSNKTRSHRTNPTLNNPANRIPIAASTKRTRTGEEENHLTQLQFRTHPHTVIYTHSIYI